MVGRLNDPQFGQLDASSYLAFSLNELNLPSLTEDAVLDSAKLAFSVSYLFDSSLLNRRLSISAFEIGEEFIDTTYKHKHINKFWKSASIRYSKCC